MTRIESARGLERHFQTAIQILIVALLVWNFKTVQEMSVTVARQEEKIVGLTASISMLSRVADERYRNKDADKDFAVRDRIILSLDARVTALENAISIRK